MPSIKAGLLSSLPKGSNVVLFASEKAKTPLNSALVGSLVQKAYDAARDDGFEGARDQVSVVRTESKSFARLIFVGLGPQNEIDMEALRRAAAKAARKATELGLRSLAVPLPSLDDATQAAAAVTEGTCLGLYQFTQFKSPSKNRREVESVALVAKTAADLPAFRTGIFTGVTVSDAVIFVRDLVNTPPSDMDPQKMAGIARSELKPPVQVRVYKKPDIQKLKMGALLGVNRGSVKDPVFLHLIYKPKKGPIRRKIGLCGKGITFDSGGLSLKPAKSMENMKDDMAGAATVLAVFRALSVLQPPVEVHGFTPITENMPGGDAVKPGDVLKTMGGKTIEVLNTDAEGRLVLSDALGFAGRQNLDEVIDIATLTGACVVALGPGIAGLMGNDDTLLAKIQNAARLAGEKIWPLPLEKEYQPMLKSHIADIKNIGPAGVAGTILAGLFLKEFVKPGLPWAHIDIASTAWNENGTPLSPPGATGVMVRTLLTYLLSHS